MLIVMIEILAILVPFAGFIALLHNQQQSKSSIRLLLASLGCLVMNIGTLLMETAQNEPEASMAVRFEYFGNALFFFFFILFLIAYLRLKVPKLPIYCWGLFECAVAVIHWNERIREVFIGHYYFVRHESFHVFTAHISEQSPLYFTRNVALFAILCAGMCYTAYRMQKTKLPAAHINLFRLTGAQFVLAAALVLEEAVRPELDLLPVFCSLSLLSVVISMLTGDFFGVTDSGHEWVFRQMVNPYIITDNQYGYLDANEHAKELFPSLRKLRPNERVPQEIVTLFTANTTHFEMGEEAFERKLTEIRKKDALVGYGLLLEDDTEQQKYVRLLNSYNSRLQIEVEKKTEHIRKVQNSITTGLASVVESRDNSTGGHINRTSLVVHIFAQKLLEQPEILAQYGLSSRFLHNVAKAAPMHDLGKIAVDDEILRKPGKFTDAEYAEMQKHPAEGAKILQKVLHEVDDEDFVRIAINIAHFHHEHYDGTGYPEHLSGNEIPVEARIMALADVFDALVSKRCYKEAYSYQKALTIMEQSLGTLFDPVLGKAFLGCREELISLYTEIEQNSGLS